MKKERKTGVDGDGDGDDIPELKQVCLIHQSFSFCFFLSLHLFIRKNLIRLTSHEKQGQKDVTRDSLSMGVIYTALL